MKEQQCSGPCQQLERQLVAVREELAEALGAWVMRCYAPTTVAGWGGDTSTDTLVFVRIGRPMFFSGSSLTDEDEMLNYFLVNKESFVRSLTDDNFEHETQASTGATTGDWLVVFTNEHCGGPCDRLMPHLETTAGNLRGRKNVALVYREGGGAVTTRRFGVTHFPAVILFRLGRLYRYSHSSLTAGDLTAFAEDSFRNAKAEDIPKPKSPFDDVTQAIADWLRENPWTFLGGIAGAFMAILVLVLLNSPPPSSWTKQAKKKKK